MKAVLSPRELAKAIGVSESSLKRWADDGLIEVSRTAGGHRRIAISDAIRFIRESDTTVVRPEVLGMPELAEATAADLADPAAEKKSRGERLFDMLNAGRADQARGMITAWYLGGDSVATLCDGPIREAMTRMGELWKHGDDGIYREHHATDICIQSLHHLRALLKNAADHAPVALGGCPDEDPYMLPSLMCATVAADCGFRAINVGPFSPVAVLKNAIDLHAPRILWYSATAPIDPKTLNKNLDALAAAMAEHSGTVIVGGRRTADARVASRDNIHTVETMAELASFARGVIAAHAPAHDGAAHRDNGHHGNGRNGRN